MKPHVIYGVHVTNRVKSVPDVQEAFTQFGCMIRTRVGMHDVHDDYCSPAGLIVLEVFGKGKDLRKFEKRLKGLKGVDFQKMVFEH
jgi:metal-responsive CopG/Arc/MetJ family transcriptional regulator